MSIRLARIASFGFALLFLAGSAAAQENLLAVNPGFESGGPYYGWAQGTNQTNSFAGWTAYKHVQAVNRNQGVLRGDGTEGSYCFDADAAGFLRTADDACPSVIPGRLYEIRFSAKKTDVRTSSWAGIVPRAIFYNDADAPVKTVYGEEALGANSTTGWQEFVFRAVAPAGAVRVALHFDFEFQRVSFEDTNPAAGFRLDHVRLFEVPQFDGVAIRRAPMFVVQGGTNEVVLKHRSPVPRDLLLRLIENGQTLAESRIPIAPGRGVVTNFVVTPAQAPRSESYSWEARVVPVGAPWESALASKAVTGVFLDETPEGAGTFPANHPRLVLEGRWTAPTDGASERQAIWQGTSLHARFQGTSFKMRYDYATRDLFNRLRLSVVVDGDESTWEIPQFRQGTNLVATLAGNLSDGVHTITLMREGDEVQGDWVLRSVELDPGRGLLRYAPHMNRRIEFYGDSSTSGREGGMWLNYSTATARGVGASYSVVSKDATGISGGTLFTYNALWYWDRATWDTDYRAEGAQPYAKQPTPDPAQLRGRPWGPGNFDAYGDVTTLTELPDKGGFGQWSADAVVIAYGHNDRQVVAPWAENYRQFVILLRKVYPRAHIFCTHTSLTGDQNWMQQAIEPIVADRGPGGVNADGRVHIVLLRPSGRGNHPPPIDHFEMAHGNANWRGLIDQIEEAVGWGVDCPAGTSVAIRATRVASRAVRLNAAGADDCACVVEASSDFANWQPVLTNRSGFPVILAPVTDTQRFFRAVYAKNGADFFPSPVTPVAPDDLRITAVSTNSIALAWADNAIGEQGFFLERRTNGGPFVVVATLPANSTNFVDGGLAPATFYAYRIRAFSTTGESPNSAEASAFTEPVLRPPLAPSSLRIAAVSASAIVMEWLDNSDNEQGFVLERRTTTGSFAVVASIRPDTTSFFDVGLAESTFYSYRIRAFNAAGSSPNSLEAGATTEVIPRAPSAPSGLRITLVTTNAIALAWSDNADNEAGFRLERRTASGAFELIASLPANAVAFTDTGLTDATFYGYRVRAFNAVGESPNSSEAGAMTEAIPRVPSAPSGLRVTAVTTNTIALVWSDNSDNEAGFRLERRTASGAFELIATLPANAVAFTDTGLRDATFYGYRVRAFNAESESPNSPEAGATTETIPREPSAPSGLRITAVTTNTIALVWSDNANDETGFRLERRTATGAFALIATLPPNTIAFTDTGLADTTFYAYRVRTFNGVGESPNSPEASATTQAGPGVPSAPSALRVTGVATNSITLAWTDNASNEDGFLLERRTAGGNFSPVAGLPANSTTFTDTGLAPATMYTYRLRAFNAAGNSTTSNEASTNTAAFPPRGPFVVSGSVWRYNSTGADLGTAWRASAYDDSAWASGPSELGYGDGDEATIIPGGPSSSRFRTSYFRRAFTVSNAPAVRNLLLRVVRDDGIVVYLNGVEVFRDNMPAGPILYATEAPSAVVPPQESAWFSATIDPALLVNGVNVIAAEVHQTGATSSDLSFNLELAEPAALRGASLSAR